MELNENNLNIHTKFQLERILFLFIDTENTSFQTQQHTHGTSGHTQSTLSSQKYLRAFVINFGKVRFTEISLTSVLQDFFPFKYQDHFFLLRTVGLLIAFI
jgi:hypothetical protein